MVHEEAGSTVPAASASTNDTQAAHLGLVQGVINRMGQNAFTAKTWTVTILAAVFALGPLTERSKLDGVAIVLPLLIAWALDAYYLRQERLFRRLYEAAARGEVEAFSMNTKPYESAVDCLPSFIVAHGVWPLHTISIVAVALRAVRG